MDPSFNPADYEPSYESTFLVSTNVQSDYTAAFQAGEILLQHFTNKEFAFDISDATEASALSTESEDIPPHKADTKASVPATDKPLDMSVAKARHVPKVSFKDAPHYSPGTPEH
eukprot:CAMPEP_0197386842 /NCGR_PEP_ID=MMETSP1165-20131217/135_1 /TAXON_ID=284809 /ORGANISM="Chrysocystis fragilis, Strain CCMP3189" /LENGTH=113 /DNA_ID=CAMNT_0042912107 /DNA_START=104 /DNA_END=442 /DNA_ORIENTATION=-